MRRTSAFNVVSVAAGLAFLYLPIVILVIYSFNASRLVTVWGGWSLAWYRELTRDQAMLDAAWISLRIGALSATLATALGTLAAVALTRAGRFRGRLLFSGMVYAPLVMPEVITGLSLLLLFVAVNVDRGFWTVTAAHTTLTMCFVTVIVQSRLIGFDRSLEEAAMDLGCPPLKALFKITLPLIVANLIAGGLLAFSFAMLEVSDSLILAQKQLYYPITKAIYELFQLLGDGKFIASALGVWAMAFLGITITGMTILLGKKLGAIFRV